MTFTQFIEKWGKTVFEGPVTTAPVAAPEFPEIRLAALEEVRRKSYRAGARKVFPFDLILGCIIQILTKELIDQIQALRQGLVSQTAPASETPKPQSTAAAKAAQTENVSGDVQEGTVGPNTSPTEEPYKWGKYTPNLGYKVADTEHGDLSVSIYTYGRYLNQLGLDSKYADAFGNTKSIAQRQDFQLQKVQIKFLGWMFDPKFRYFLYAWTSNPSQGLPAQVVLAGNLNYTFADWFSVGAGIRSLPGTRSVEGNFPFWLSVDSRLMADEFF